jgi:hypothetical protein
MDVSSGIGLDKALPELCLPEIFLYENEAEYLFFFSVFDALLR